MSHLQERVALITGGASGIGKGIVERFAREGARIVVTDVDVARGVDVASSVDGIFVRCDVTVESDISASVAAALDHFGRLDCYVANAGFAFAEGPITDLENELFEKDLSLLVRGVAFAMKHAIGVMRDQGGGSFITTSSVSALSAGMGPHIYSACKAAVNSLTRTVAYEEGVHGIRVNCVCPGSIATAFPAKRVGIDGDEERMRRLDDAIAAAWTPVIPLGRRGTSADIANAVAWLASDDAGYVTGQEIVVDGGMILGRTLPDVPDV
ncbi:SDR family oxidoreductase [Acrocarpospora macrocephala]|uniref:Short chain dehydrogenase n=1 Tax=Acrocarpospora macrocephala TaxID=150177 RepID=A0A5M3WN97_9ACTN|nr:SDR family oxidoreductase [Acrocarpospora macrocephala]GES09639.1 short chain dehydrogenase [Acrocarpospora macrocephala]